MTRPQIPDEIVRRAVVAKGHVRDHGGIGASMRAALDAVLDDLAALILDHYDRQETPQ